MYLLSRLSVVFAVASVLLSMMVVATAASTLTSDEGKGGSVRGTIREDPQEQPASSSSSSSPHNTNGQTQTQTQGHRMLTAGTVAELVLYDIEYGATADYPQGHSAEIWELHLSEEDAETLGLQDVELVHPENIITSSATISGDYITIHESLILVDNKLHLPREENVVFSHSNPNNTDHHLNESEVAHNEYATQTSSVREQVQQAIQRHANENDGEEVEEEHGAEVEIDIDQIGLRDQMLGGTIIKDHEEQSPPSPMEVRIPGEHASGGGSDTTTDGEVQGRRRRNRRNLASLTAGPLQTLVIRVIDANNKSLTNGREGFSDYQEITMEKLENDVFLDASSLKTQYEACSYNKLQIVPYEGTTSKGRTITNGVTELHLPTYVAQGGDRKQIHQAALAAVKTDISKNMYSEFDLVMFCMPPGTNATFNTKTGKSEGGWLAYAVIGGSTSFYNNQWCGYVSAQLHEVGHNLNLYHSQEQFIQKDPEKSNIAPYGDKSGMMGSATGMDDTKMCFNPAKNWQLQWYEDQSKVLNPLIDLEMETNNYKTRVALNGVADYGKNDQAIVVLQLGHSEEPAQTATTDNYFIGFNRASGINAQTREDGDRVTIQRKTGDPLQHGYSIKLESGLALFESYTIHDFEPGRDVKITFLGLANDEALDNYGRDATIEIIDLSHYSPDKHEDTTNCHTYTVTTTTDGYQNDNEWWIFEKGAVGALVATSPTFPTAKTTYNETLCLPYNTTYIYSITDAYGDGICCGQGQGGFKIEDLTSDPPVYVLGGGTYFDDSRADREDGDVDLETEKEIRFSVGLNPNPNPNSVGDDECLDTEGKFIYLIKKNGKTKKTTCEKVGKKKKLCDTKYKGDDENLKGETLSKLCPVACKLC